MDIWVWAVFVLVYAGMVAGQVLAELMRIKRKFKNYEIYHPLIDRTLVMVFEKNSTRTRFSFDAAIRQLGGASIIANAGDMQLGRGEPVEDTAAIGPELSSRVVAPVRRITSLPPALPCRTSANRSA